MLILISVPDLFIEVPYEFIGNNQENNILNHKYFPLIFFEITVEMYMACNTPWLLTPNMSMVTIAASADASLQNEIIFQC